MADVLIFIWIIVIMASVFRNVGQAIVKKFPVCILFVIVLILVTVGYIFSNAVYAIF